MITSSSRPFRWPPVVVLVAHGSRDPRAGDATRALARAVAAASPTMPVRPAFLEFAGPHPSDVLACLGGRRAVVVPLLLTPAYHARSDIPSIVDAARQRGASVSVAPVLGPDIDAEPAPDEIARLVSALVMRLGRLDADGVLLAAAGSRDPRALASVDVVAGLLGRSLGVPCSAGYASGIGRPVEGAIADLRGAGATEVAMASYFLAPGLLYDRARSSAIASGAIVLAEPLIDAPDVVSLVVQRALFASVMCGPEALAVVG